MVNHEPALFPSSAVNVFLASVKISTNDIYIFAIKAMPPIEA